MLINSPGGNVVASMEFGAALRELGMAAIVAGYGSDGMRRRGRRRANACRPASMR